VYHFIGGTPLSVPMGGDQDAGIEASHEGEETDDAAVSPSFRAEYWELVNRGPGGIGVIKHIRPNNPIGVGEVMGIQFPKDAADPERWALGVVRWLSIANEGEYQAGVEIFAPEAWPAVIRGDLGARPALIIPNAGTPGAGSLVTHCGVYARDRVLDVEAPGEQLRVRAVSLLDTTPGFERFSYQSAG
jgi:hypothetical protein